MGFHAILKDMWCVVYRQVCFHRMAAFNQEIFMTKNRSLYALAAAAGVALAALGGVSTAQARDVNWAVGVSAPGVSVGVGNGYSVYSSPAPVYYAPAPVYYAPAPPPPVYYAPPRPVYYAPPVVIAPPAYGYYRGGGRQHRHDRHDRHDRGGRGGHDGRGGWNR